MVKNTDKKGAGRSAPFLMLVIKGISKYLPFPSFVEDPEFFGGEELKVRSNKKMRFTRCPKVKAWLKYIRIFEEYIHV